MSSQISSVASESVRVSVSGREQQTVGLQQRGGAKNQNRTNSSTSESVPANANTASAEKPTRPTESDATTKAALLSERDLAKQLNNAVAQVRERITDVRRELQFSVDESSGRTIITVIDSDSGKIIRQIPPEELLEMADSLDGGDVNLIDSQV